MQPGDVVRETPVSGDGAGEQDRCRQDTLPQAGRVPVSPGQEP